jgi:predicted acyltransferase
MPGRLYQKVWDPEGILSTFPSIVTGITGLLAGRLLLKVKSQEYKVIWLFLAGFLATILGVVWNWVFPLNENLWTSSFVLFTSGLASMTLAASIFIVDILNYRKAAQFGVIYGMNAIAIYVLADIFALFFYIIKFGGSSLNEHFFNIFTAAGLAPKFVSMVYALIYVGILFIPAWLLYRKKIFIKL